MFANLHCFACQYLSRCSKSTRYPLFPDALMRPSNFVTSA